MSSFYFQYNNTTNPVLLSLRACAEIVRVDLGYTMAQTPAGLCEKIDANTVQVWLYADTATRDADFEAGHQDNALATREVSDQGVVSTP